MEKENETLQAELDETQKQVTVLENQCDNVDNMEAKYKRIVWDLSKKLTKMYSDA